jgi:hypothetical protein
MRATIWAISFVWFVRHTGTSLSEPFPLRPRYIHHRKYQTLRARYMSLSRQNTVDLRGFVSRLKRRIGATR